MHTTSELISVAAVAIGALWGAVMDVRTRRIPNYLTLPLAVAGLLFAALGVTHVTLRAAMMGFVLGLGTMLPGYLLGATGAGDVKLFAALATFLGVECVPAAFVATALAGGVLAGLVALARGRLAVTLGRTARLLAAPGTARAAVEASAEDNTFPYGPAVAVGCVLAVWRC